MAGSIDHSTVWGLARRQHGVVARSQLTALGFTRKALEHRISRGRLHVVHRGVYAAGRPELTQHGRWMAAVLACGPGAALSHHSAGQLWGILPHRPGPIHVSVSAARRPKRTRIVTHRRASLETTHRLGIPLTRPTATLTDLATQLRRDALEAAINEADKLDVIDPERLRQTITPGM